MRLVAMNYLSLPPLFWIVTCGAALLLSGCRTKGNSAQALSEVLATVNDAAREVSIEEYEADLRGGVPRAHTFSGSCDGFSVRVASPGEWDEVVTTIPSRQQTWEINVRCNTGDLRKVRAELVIDKTFEANERLGTARISGNIKGPKARDCEVDMVLEFETASGAASVMEGEICGKPAGDFGESWVVPGYSGEHLVGEY